MSLYEVVGSFLFFGALLITLFADIILRIRYSKYKGIKVESNMTGAEVAREILKNNGLENVYVVETKGILSDHYDSNQKVIRLSRDIYRNSTIASVSVAAHECGHALQDKEGYMPLYIRTLFLPLVSFGTKFGYVAVLIGLLFHLSNIAWIGAFLLSFLLLFQLVTLPVEVDASERGKDLLLKGKMITKKERVGSAKMLFAAAMTYVASLLSTLIDLLRLVLLIITNNEE